jgi:hypothetical protein
LIEATGFEAKIVNSDMPNIDQIRYLFKCEKYGYDMMFGAVTQWEPEEKLNITLEEASCEEKADL